MQDKQLEMQHAHEQELLEIESEILQQQADLTAITRENTQLLTSLATLEKDRRGLETALNTAQRKVAVSAGAPVCEHRVVLSYPCSIHAC